MKGIILGGGNGSRLYPASGVTNKLLLPVYDKPMVYYPLTTLIDAGITDIMIITNKRDNCRFRMLFGNGRKFGCHISYGIQDEPTGTASAFLIAEKFVGEEPCALIFGDNIFYEDELAVALKRAALFAEDGICSLFGKEVSDPERFGVVELDENKNAISIEEKPAHPKSNYAVAGLYFFPGDVVAKAHMVKPSARGEYEITDLINFYLEERRVKVETMGKNCLWLDAGTFDSMLEASRVVAENERKGIMIGVPEVAAYKLGTLPKEILLEVGTSMKKNTYGQYLLRVAE